MDKLLYLKNDQLRWLKSVIDDLKDALDSDKEQSQICLMKVSDRWSRYDSIVLQMLDSSEAMENIDELIDE
ncbi:hypothetical protein T11_15206 [Trichinella zimbabwensis]|uniref:Uncharacterized protein n=1 Tax=Trichinella zimbabwensis TaxID=268475 RepID=A0A0V1HLI7_9BILA|nr:hypothetical protein T11_15206 [Trichinella zimbabwensis]